MVGMNGNSGVDTFLRVRQKVKNKKKRDGCRVASRRFLVASLTAEWICLDIISTCPGDYDWDVVIAEGHRTSCFWIETLAGAGGKISRALLMQHG